MPADPAGARLDPSSQRRSYFGTMLRQDWPVIWPVAVQITLAAGVAIAISLAIGHQHPWFAALFAVTGTELICARHHRRVVEMAFGVAVGVLIGASAGTDRAAGHAVLDAVIGSAVALAVALASTPRNPVAEVRAAADPLLGQLAGRVRVIGAALAAGNAPAAGEAVYQLGQADDGLRRLTATLAHVRRSMMITRWWRGQDLTVATSAATEIGYAVTNLRSMALQTWWGLLRGREPVPEALPHLLESLADSLALLRGQWPDGPHLRDARRELISCVHWLTLLRGESPGAAGAALTASAQAAILNLLIASGLPVNVAQDALRRPLLAHR